MQPPGRHPVTPAPPKDPFRWLSPSAQRLLLAVAALLTALLMVAINWSNAPLKNPVAPWGMISLQLAGTLSGVQAILASWGPREQLFAAFNLGIDYLYMLAYATTLGLGCLLLARRRGAARRVAVTGVCLSWGMLAALLLDAVENLLLMRLLLGDLQERWAALASWCAVPKFALVLAALLYLVIGGGCSLLRRGQARHGGG